MGNPSVTSRRALLRRALGGTFVLAAGQALAACGGAAAVTTSTASVAASTAAVTAATGAASPTTAVAATSVAPSSSAAAIAGSAAASASSAASTSAAPAAAVTSASSTAVQVPRASGATLSWMVEISGSATQKTYDDFLKPWNQQHPQATAESYSIGGGDANKVEKILTLAAAGTALDVIGKVTFIQPIAKPGAVQPLQPFLARDKYDISGYNQGWLKTFGTLDGKLYSLPWGLGGNAIAFIYSPEALAAAGLTPPSQDWKNPWSWADYRDYAAKLTKKQGDTYQRVGTDELGNWDYTVPMAFGAHWVSPDGKTAICDSPEMIDALTKYLDMILKDKSTAATPGVKLDGDNAKHFANGQSAMSYIGGWQMTTWTDPAKYKTPYVMATFPKGSAASPDMDTIQLALGADIKHPDDAWSFMQWLLQDGRYANLVFRMPALTTDATSWSKTAFAKVPATASPNVLVEALAIATAPDPVRAIPKNAQFENDIATPLWNNLLAGKITVQQGLSEAKRQLQALLT